MDIQQIISQLQGKFGNSFDIAKVTDALRGIDLKNTSFNDIVAKLASSGLISGIVGDLDGDGKKENLADELKGKAAGMLGGLGGMFGK